jgi:hypothetical protein
MRVYALLAAVLLACAGCGGGPAPEFVPTLDKQLPEHMLPAINLIGGVADQQTVSGKLALSASGNGNTERITLRIDGIAQHTDQGGSFSWEWNTNQAPDGWHMLEFFAQANGAVRSRYVMVNVAHGEVVEEMELSEGQLAAVVEPPAEPRPAEPKPQDPQQEEPPTPVGETVLPRTVEGEAAVGLLAKAVSSGEQSICELPTSPRLILCGVKDGDTLSRTVYVSAFAADDVGVSSLQLFVQGHPVAQASGPTLDAYIDTTEFEDGECEIFFAAPDESHTFHFGVSCTIDNSTDRWGPDLTWSESGLDDPATPEVDHFFAPGSTVEIDVTDQTGIELADVWLELNSAGGGGQVMLAHFYSTSGPTQKTLEVTLEPTLYAKRPPFARDGLRVFFKTRDTLGQEQSGYRDIVLRADSGLYGVITAPNGRPVVGALLEHTGPGLLEGPGTNVSNHLGIVWDREWNSRYDFRNHAFTVTKGDYSGEINHTLGFNPSTEQISLTTDYFTPQYDGAHLTQELGIVTGAEDDMWSVVRKLDDTFWATYWDKPVDLDDVHLIDGDDSLPGGPNFDDVLGNYTTLYNFRALFIESGADEAILSNVAYMNALRTWVEDGGKLFCSGKAYDFIERIFPQYIDFANGGGGGLSETPEQRDAAQTGTATATRNVTDGFAEATLRTFATHHGSDPIAMAGWPEDYPGISAVAEGVLPEGVVGTDYVALRFYPGLGMVVFTSYLASDGTPEGEDVSAQDEALKHYITYLD